MHLALRYLKDKQADGMLTAGNSAVFVYNAYATIGLLEHIKKPAFMPFVPTIDGGVTNLIDLYHQLMLMVQIYLILQSWLIQLLKCVLQILVLAF